ncbi:MAG: DUF106 domain-containing protein [Haloarculaceae archaeon]
MARTAEKVESLAEEDGSLVAALESVLSVAEEQGTVEWRDVSDEITSGQWGRLIETGLLTDADGSGFVVDDPDGVRSALTEDDVERAAAAGDDEGEGWSIYDKAAGLVALAMMAGYSLPAVRNTVGSTVDVIFGPLESTLPFYVVIMVLAVLTGLYSTLLQNNLVDMDKMSAHQEKIQEIEERRKAAKERGDDEALERIQEERMEVMGDQMGAMKSQFRPMVWIMLLTIPVFLWMYWMLLSQPHLIHPATITMPLIGQTKWTNTIVGPMQAWIVWYFLCSLGFTQIIRKSLNVQTTPT